MFKLLKKIDTFEKNILLVFLGTFLVNIFNLLYQVLIAHRVSGVDFASFNSLLAIFMVIAVPLQTTLVKYTAVFKAKENRGKIKALFFKLCKINFSLAILTFLIFYFFSSFIINALRIESLSAGYILSLMIAISFISPVFLGALQGLELFGWLALISIIAGALKLILAFVFVNLGFNVSGALSAFLIASLMAILIPIFPLKKFFAGHNMHESVDLKEFFYYLLPVALSSFCFMAMVNFDIVIVKYLFTPEKAGSYSLAQMLGKIFLFFPAAIGIVMFPRTAGLNAKNMDTRATLSKSLLYAAFLCILANVFYNLFPVLILKILTGKSSGEVILLGRLFGFSMSFFTLMYILVNYFLSIKELRFIKFLVLGTVLQFLAITVLHAELIQVQLIMCINAAIMFILHAVLAYKGRRLEVA
ncbi:MAG: oligosaccharide flippase family protein [Candidatus Omnitrophota bacterium]